MISGITHYQLKEDKSAVFAQHSYLKAVSKQVCKDYHSLKTFAGIAAHLFEQSPCSISPLKSAFLCVGECKAREGRVLEAAELLYSTGTLIRWRCGSVSGTDETLISLLLDASILCPNVFHPLSLPLLIFFLFYWFLDSSPTSPPHPADSSLVITPFIVYPFQKCEKRVCNHRNVSGWF